MADLSPVENLRIPSKVNFTKGMKLQLFISLRIWAVYTVKTCLIIIKLDQTQVVQIGDSKGYLSYVDLFSLCSKVNSSYSYHTVHKKINKLQIYKCNF